MPQRTPSLIGPQCARIFHIMAVQQRSLEKQIQKVKQQIAELGDLRPGALSQQYNVCGNPSCRCKADPPIKHGPYYQISFTLKGRSTSQFVRQEDVALVRRQLANYHRLRELIDEWIALAFQLSKLRLLERRQRVSHEKTAPKPRIPSKSAKPRSK